MRLRQLAPAFALALGLAVGLEARAQPAADTSSSSSGPEQTGGFLSRRAYLHVSPGLFSTPLSPRSAVFYAWGLGAGYHLATVRNLILEVGGFFEHTLSVTPRAAAPRSPP